jgi:hypothetical protein
MKGGTALTHGSIDGYRVSGIYTAESGRSVATLLNIPQIPFATPDDGTQWNGFGGVLGQTLEASPPKADLKRRVGLCIVRLLCGPGAQGDFDFLKQNGSFFRSL